MNWWQITLKFWLHKFLSQFNTVKFFLVYFTVLETNLLLWSEETSENMAFFLQNQMSFSNLNLYAIHLPADNEAILNLLNWNVNKPNKHKQSILLLQVCLTWQWHSHSGINKLCQLIKIDFAISTFNNFKNKKIKKIKKYMNSILVKIAWLARPEIYQTAMNIYLLSYQLISHHCNAMNTVIK